MTTQTPDAQGRVLGPNDKALVERIQTGDSDALRSLYSQYQPDLSRFLRRLALSPSAVESIIDDAFMMLREKQIPLEEAGRLEVVIYRAAYRLAAAVQHSEDDPGVARGDPQNLAEAISELRPAHRAVLELTFYHRFHYRDVALIMGCSEEAVMEQAHDALNFIKGRLPADWSL